MDIEVSVDMTGNGKAVIIKKDEIDIFTNKHIKGIFILEIDNDKVSLIKRVKQDEYYLVRKFWGTEPFEERRVSIPEAQELIKDALIKKWTL